MCNVAVPNECRLKSYNIVQFYLCENQKQAKIVSSAQQDSVTMNGGGGIQRPEGL